MLLTFSGDSSDFEDHFLLKPVEIFSSISSHAFTFLCVPIHLTTDLFSCYLSYLLLAGWNKLFFLWGVFQGRRTGCMEPSSQKQIFSQKIPSAIMSLPENICSVRPVDKDLSECDESASVSDALASKEFPCLSSSRTSDGDCNIRVASHTPSDYQKQTVIERQNHRVDSSSTMVVERSNPEAREEIDTSISHEEPQRITPSLVMLISSISIASRWCLIQLVSFYHPAFAVTLLHPGFLSSALKLHSFCNYIFYF